MLRKRPDPAWESPKDPQAPCDRPLGPTNEPMKNNQNKPHAPLNAGTLFRFALAAVVVAVVVLTAFYSAHAQERGGNFRRQPVQPRRRRPAPAASAARRAGRARRSRHGRRPQRTCRFASTASRTRCATLTGDPSNSCSIATSSSSSRCARFRAAPRRRARP